MRKFSFATLLCFTGASCAVANSVDIYNDIYNLRNKDNSGSGIFYLKEVQTYTPWAWGAKFTQNYVNGTLIFGHTTQESGSGRIWFGRAGDIGYITANFNAKNIYLTGTLGAGNGAKTGGGATLNFISSTKAVLQDWNLELAKAGTQNSHFSLDAQSIEAQNISIKNETGGNVVFRADSFDFHATSIASYGKVAFEGGTGGSSQIVIDSLSLSGGTLDLSKNQAYIKISNITMSGTNLQSKGISGVLNWSGFKNAGNQDIQGSYEYQNNSLILEGLLTPTGTLTLNAQEVNAMRARIELDGSTKILNATGAVRLGDLRLNHGSKATFESLRLERHGSITLQNQGSVTAKNLEVHGNIKFFSSDASHTPITIEGQTKIFVGDRKRNDPILSIYNINQIRGLRAGQEYTLIVSNGGITSVDLGGKNLLDFVGFYEKEGGVRFDNAYGFDYGGLTFTKTLSQNSLGFKIEASANPANPYTTDRIEYWIYHRGGQELVDRVNAVGEGTMELFQNLMMVRNGEVWTNGVIMGGEVNHLVKVGENIQNANTQLKSLQRKTSDLELLKFAVDTQNENRLSKLMLQRKGQLQKPKNQTDAWGSVLVGAKSLETNKGMLYGASVGYDHVSDYFLMGGFVAYGYGVYKGGLVEGDSHNAGVGLYGRFFMGGNEIDFGASGLMGWNQEGIVGNETITDQLSQKYHFNARSANANLNYGYAFGFWKDRIAFKPIVAVHYAYLTSSRIDGEASNPLNQDLAVNAGEESGHIVSANLALETRVAAGKSSYWWLLLEASQDVYSSVLNNKSVRFAGTNALGTKEIDSKNLNFALSLGGEIRLFERAFVNFSVGSELGAFQKDGKLAGNIGLEYSF